MLFLMHILFIFVYTFQKHYYGVPKETWQNKHIWDRRKNYISMLLHLLLNNCLNQIRFVFSHTFPFSHTIFAISWKSTLTNYVFNCKSTETKKIFWAILFYLLMYFFLFTIIMSQTFPLFWFKELLSAQFTY